MIDVARLPVYSLSEAARLVGVARSKAQRWMRGYTRQTPAGPRLSEPIIAADARDAVSFLDLVELRFVAAFVSAGVSVQTIRKVLEETKDLEPDHPFSRQTFYTDGKAIFIKSLGRILESGSGGQYAMLIDQVFKRFDFTDGQVSVYYPADDRSVRISPAHSFGAPTVAGTSIRTAVLYDAYIAEGSREAVAEWFGLSLGNVEAAIDFESSIGGHRAAA
jgi:uncharacterized protein (DUF433 family)